MAAKPRRHPRIERDSLGELEVQHKVRYGIHTTRALRHLNFSPRSLSGYFHYLGALMRVKIETGEGIGL